MRTLLPLVMVALLPAALLGAGEASAQRLQPMALDAHQAPTGPLDGTFVQQPATIEGGSFFAQLRFDYLLRPLVLVTAGGASREAAELPVVEHRLGASLALAYGLADGLMMYASLPVVLYQRGDELGAIPTQVATSALGDASVGVNAMLYGEALGFSLGLGIALTLPTGDEASFASDDRVGGSTHLRVAWNERRVGVAAHVGANLRPSRQWVTHRSGADLVAALAVFVWATPAFRLGLELAGATGLTDRSFADPSRSSLQLALSGRVKLSQSLFMQLGADAALVEAVGSPALRGTLSVGVRTDRGR